MELLKAEDMVTMYAHTFTKKDAIATGRKLVEDIYEAGKLDPIKVATNIIRLKEVINEADKTFREKMIFDRKETYNGMSFEPKNGAKKFNYDEDPIYNELVAKVKGREELLKVASNSKDSIFDSEGMEVPKVSFSFNKPSITITF